MREIILRLAISFSVLVAGMHMPATAHAESGIEAGLHHDHHADQSDDAANNKSDGSLDVGSDVMHHHHCPVGLDANPVDMIAALPHNGSLLLPASSAALYSHATAPPLQPPLA